MDNTSKNDKDFKAWFESTYPTVEAQTAYKQKHLLPLDAPIERSKITPIIKPVSDLNNYNDVLQDVDIDEPVFLTKNGRGKYAILAITNKPPNNTSNNLFIKLASIFTLMEH